jgi:hypothetical protein
MANPTRREQVFFSYSHKDKKWLERFQATLKPLIRASQLSVWDDTKIKAGDIWRDEIKQALASAKVAVLLVSTNFLNSDFIAENELPPLLEAAQTEGLRILLVVVGHSLFDETELGRFQTVNDPTRPLASITAASRDKEIVRICKEIKSIVSETNAGHRHSSTYIAQGEVAPETISPIPVSLPQQPQTTNQSQPADTYKPDTTDIEILKQVAKGNGYESEIGNVLKLGHVEAGQRLFKLHQNFYIELHRPQNRAPYYMLAPKGSDFLNEPDYKGIPHPSGTNRLGNLSQGSQSDSSTDSGRGHLSEAENNAWALALRMNSISGYQSFLSRFPLSRHAIQAHQAIQIKERNVQDAARQRASEKGRRLNEQVEDAWQVALKENSILAYRDFLGAYPNSKYSGQARIQLSLLEDRFKEKG